MKRVGSPCPEETGGFGNAAGDLDEGTAFGDIAESSGQPCSTSSGRLTPRAEVHQRYAPEIHSSRNFRSSETNGK